MVTSAGYSERQLLTDLSLVLKEIWSLFKMTQNLLKTLYLGKELTPEEHADIPHYRAELHYHVLYKNLQVIGLNQCL
jgi:hypothetical protein